MKTDYGISKDGTRIACYVQGSGPALVLVDGALAYSGLKNMTDLHKGLAERFTIYAYDRRGRGESGDTQPYSIEKEIEDLAAVLNIAGKDAFVCGFSSGAALALYAAAAGLKPKKLLLYEAPFTVVDDSDRKTPKNPVGDVEELIAANKRSEAVDYFMKDIIGMPGIILPVMKLMMRKNFAACDKVAHTLAYDFTIMNQTKFHPPVETSKKITVPTLVMYGEKTAKPLKKAAHKLAELIPNVELVPVPKASHNIKAKTLLPVLAATLLNNQ